MRIQVSEHIFLSPTESSDIHSLCLFLNNAKLLANTLSIPEPYQISDADAWLKTLDERRDLIGHPTHLAIRDRHGNLIGEIGRLLSHDKAAHKDEIGYWLGQPHWGKGIMTKVLSVYSQHLFEDHGLVRLEALIFNGNIASQRILEKNNFKMEGFLQKAFKKKDQYIDAIQYAKTI